MKFSYYIMTTKEIDIDFDKVYKFVEEDTKNHDPNFIYDAFLNDICYYLEEIYDLCDIEDVYFLDSVVTSWNNYMEDNYEI